jgi:hypothetical protein
MQAAEGAVGGGEPQQQEPAPPVDPEAEAQAAWNEEVPQ